MKSLKMITLATLVLVAFSCQKKGREGIDPAAEFKASANVADSFQVVTLPTTDLSVDQAHVVLKKSALDKEFLLSVNIISQTPTPSFSSLQSRVVSFILRDHKVYLLDVTKTHVVGENNITQNLLLAEYAVLSEDADTLTIDFNEGMKKIFTAGEMFASDDDSASSQYLLPVAQVSLSYLDEVKMNAEALFVRQVAQVEIVSEKNEIKAEPIEVRYQIKPYLPDTSFVPTRSLGFDKVGYFEANPILLKDGSSILYASKWNLKKPVVFAISANTPAEYRDLVKNAILYWNKTLGENKIEVIQLTDAQITAPAFDYNIIQWVDYDAAGAAYADIHMDPRSGEVTSAQVFFPSAFIHSLVEKRVRLTAGRKVSSSVGLKGFKSARVCHRDLSKDLLGMDLSAITTDEMMNKAMRDYVYEVIAHEVGHVMGLRHNFAGNLVANYDAKDRKDLILSYYKNKKAPAGIVDSSSVMEYSRFEESAWNGDTLQQPGAKALTYDEMAMQYLYKGVALPAVRPPFCTDSHISVYADCNHSDAGRSVVSSALGMYQFNLNTLAARVLNLYISKSKKPDEKNDLLIPVSEVNLDAKKMVKTLGVDLAKFVSLLKADTKLIAVRSAQMPILSTQDSEIEKAEKKYLENEVNRLGGLEQVLTALPIDYDLQLQKRFSNLLDDPFYNSGKRADGTIYTFTDAEKVVMEKQVALFSAQVKEGFVLNEIKALSGEKFSFAETYGQGEPEEKAKWADSDLTESFTDLLLKRFSYYAFTHAANVIESDVTAKDGTRTNVELPTYVFSQDIRLASATVFSNEAVAIDWAVLEKEKALEAAANEIKVIGAEDQLVRSSLSKEALKWLLVNKEIISTLNK